LVDGDQLGRGPAVFGDHHDIPLALHIVDDLQTRGFESGNANGGVHEMTMV
jgi:hypothetical protein